MTDNITTPASNEDLSKIEKQLTQVKPDLFKGISQAKKNDFLRMFSISYQCTHIGPLPDVDTLKGYSEIIPDGANRIMTMAEEQSKHRIALEGMVAKKQLNQSNIGQFLAFFICISFIAAGTFCIYTGHEWPGGALGIGGLAGIITAFIKGKTHQQKNLQSKK